MNIYIYYYVIHLWHFCTLGNNKVYQPASIICSRGGGISIMLHSSFIHLCFYGPPPYAFCSSRRETWGTNVLTRNQPRLIFLNSTVNTIKRLLYVYKKFYTRMTSTLNFVWWCYARRNHLGCFLNPLLSFLKMVSTSFYQAQSCIVFSGTESKMTPLQFLHQVRFHFFRSFKMIPSYH